MPYLVDGHNLIGRMPGLSLADPDDEAKLVRLLRRFAARSRKEITVVFDRGLPAGRSSLSGAGVQVIFAPAASSADAALRRRLQGLRDAPNWTLVTSDNELAGAARQRGARVLSSDEFAALLDAPGEAEAGKAEPLLSKEEVERWEAVFTRQKQGRKK